MIIIINYSYLFLHKSKWTKNIIIWIFAVRFENNIFSTYDAAKNLLLLWEGTNCLCVACKFMIILGKHR